MILVDNLLIQCSRNKSTRNFEVSQEGSVNASFIKPFHATGLPRENIRKPLVF